jgi:Short C-terminal domain
MPRALPVRGSVAAMALLSRMIRTAAITGRTDTINAWFAGRQGGRWAEQTVRAAVPTAASRAPGTPPAVATRPPADPAKTLQQLTELHERGIVTDAEFERLRARLSV